NRAELLEWATARGMRVSLDIVHAPRAVSQIAGFKDALAAGGIHTLEAEDRESAIKAAAGALTLPDNADRETIASILIARDVSAAASGRGDGIEIPHAHDPIVIHGSRPMIVLCFFQGRA